MNIGGVLDDKICITSCINHDIVSHGKNYLKLLPLAGFEICGNAQNQSTQSQSQSQSQSTKPKKISQKKDPEDYVLIEHFTKNLRNTWLEVNSREGEDAIQTNCYDFLVGTLVPEDLKEKSNFYLKMMRIICSISRS